MNRAPFAPLLAAQLADNPRLTRRLVGFLSLIHISEPTRPY